MSLFSPRMLLILGFVALAPRFVLALYLGVWGEPEVWEYDVIAANLARGDGHTFDRGGFVYLAYAPPLWSFVLAVLLKIPGSTRASIQFLQALLCFGSAITYAALARRILGNAAVSRLVGFLVALQPSLLYYSVTKSDPLPLNVFLLGLIALSGTVLIGKPDLWQAATFGLLLALGVLARGTPIVALPLVAVWLLARRKSGAAVLIALAVAALALGLAPWLIRNERLLGRAVITTTAAENFWRGNHEGATGGVVDQDGGRITSLRPTNEALPGTIRSVIANGTEMERHDIFMNEALAFLRDQPGSAATLFARKLRTFWWQIDSDARDYSHAASLAYEVLYRGELALAFLGAFAMFRPRRAERASPDRETAAFAIALMIAISALQCAFYVQGRHRFLIEPLLLIFTALGIAAAAGAVRPSFRLRPAQG